MSYVQATTIIKGACTDPAGCERAAADVTRRLSSHRTSRGHIVYFRCYCGSLQIELVALAQPEAGRVRGTAPSLDSVG